LPENLYKTGISDKVGGNWKPTTFEINGTRYLIAGGYDGDFAGWSSGGSGWSVSSLIITGLTDVGSYSAPTVFWMNGNLYLITGNHNGGFSG